MTEQVGIKLPVSKAEAKNDTTNRIARQIIDGEVAIKREAQLGYYPFQTQNLMGKLRYGCAKQETPGADALGAATLLFPAGWNHILTLQLMIAI